MGIGNGWVLAILSEGVILVTLLLVNDSLDHYRSLPHAPGKTVRHAIMEGQSLLVVGPVDVAISEESESATIHLHVKPNYGTIQVFEAKSSTRPHLDECVDAGVNHCDQDCVMCTRGLDRQPEPPLC